jgi:hypothetical protein
MNKIECYECELCGQIFEQDGDAEGCEEAHNKAEDLNVIEVWFNKSEPDDRFPDYIRLEIKDFSGCMAEYRKVTEGSVEGFEPMHKGVIE